MPDDLESMMFRPVNGSPILMVAMSGRRAGFMEPLHFNLQFSTRGMDFNRMYIRDNFGMWYHAGLEGITDSMEGTADFLREHIEEEKYSRVVFVGISTGAYASLVLGSMLGVDAIHAFAPPVRVGEESRGDEGIRRAESVAESLEFLDELNVDQDLRDLRKVMAKFPLKPGAEAFLYHDPLDELDSQRCRSLAHFPGVNLVEVPGAGHQVIKPFLKNREFFRRIAHGT